MFLEGFENHSSVFFSLGSSFLVFWISMLGRIWECLRLFLPDKKWSGDRLGRAVVGDGEGVSG